MIIGKTVDQLISKVLSVLLTTRHKGGIQNSKSEVDQLESVRVDFLFVKHVTEHLLAWVQ